MCHLLRMAIVVEDAKTRAVEGNVIGIGWALRNRRWKDEHIGKRSTSVLREISADLEGGSGRPRAVAFGYSNLPARASR